MSFNFVFDREHLGRPYPNLADMMDASNGYHGMGDEYPWIIPCRLLYYADDHQYPVNIIYKTKSTSPENSYYPVGLGFFSFEIDYFSMLPDDILTMCKQGLLKILFYYHEGDSPFHEKSRLDSLCVQHDLPRNCYLFVSGNTRADDIDNFVYFPDHELFYWRNSVVWNRQSMPGCNPHTNPRSRRFTTLSRIHKWWRATIMSYLTAAGILNNSYWSYNNISIGDRPEDNPIERHLFTGLVEQIDRFIDGVPYSCDTQSESEHNSHWTLVKEHYEDSYCNLVLETLYDAEQSGGAFLTEKTFKPIRHAQPFIIFGCPGSLSTLKKLGYRTFDHAVDTHYDTIINNTQRFKFTVDEVEKLSKIDLHAWYINCWDDIVYNQQLFLSSKYDRLNSLYLSLSTK